MDSLQRVAQSTVSSSGSTYNSSSKVAAEVVLSDQFPAGLRVLVVDDDMVCLRIVEKMLRQCLYNVTTCSQATVALNILRQKKGSFDVVLSDVYMPDMDGYKLLEHIGLEMDLPVIMMSADSSTSAVMKGVRHGACDYLIKPIRREELKNIWQHFVRKKWNESKEFENSGSLEDNDQQKRGNDDAEYASSGNEGTDGITKNQKKRNITQDEDDGELETDDPSTSKKPRVVWSVELHQQFVTAVNQIGLDKAVPKRILELMNVSGLTRENVASHLQKYRLYLKKLSVAAQSQNSISNIYCGSVEQSIKMGSLGIPSLASSGQIPRETLAVMHSELLGLPTCSLVRSMDQPSLLQASMHGPKYNPVEHGITFGQPSVKCQSTVSKSCPQSIMSVDNSSSGYGGWPSNSLCTAGGLSGQNSTMIMDMLQPRQGVHQLSQQRSAVPDPSHAISMQPPCLFFPSQPSSGFQVASSSVSVDQQGGYNRNSVIDYSLISPQCYSSSLKVRQTDGGDLKTTGYMSACTAPVCASPSSSSCLENIDANSGCQVQSSTLSFTAAGGIPGLVSDSCSIQGPHGPKPVEILDQGSVRNFGFVGKGTSLPTQFAVDEVLSPMGNFTNGRIYPEDSFNKAKKEWKRDVLDGMKVGAPLLQQFSSDDILSVFTD